jgi:hypothetical protein
MREAAAAYQRLTSTERLEAIFDLIASGVALMEQAPWREIAQQLRASQEEAWRRAMKEVFARHVPPSG